jgi:hypothetical protein
MRREKKRKKIVPSVCVEKGFCPFGFSSFFCATAALAAATRRLSFPPPIMQHNI